MSRAQQKVTGHWNRILGGRDSTELLTQVEQVEDLLAHTGFVAIKDLVAQGRDAVLADLINGPTRSQADYARQVGYVSGLEELANAVEAFKTAAERRQKKLQARAEADGSGEAEEAS